MLPQQRNLRTPSERIVDRLRIEHVASHFCDFSSRNYLKKLKRKYSELLTNDEHARENEKMRITLDLDDSAKVNYGKFGGLLDSVKAVTRGVGDE